MRTHVALWWSLVVVMVLAGCGGKTNMESFLRDEVDLTYVTRVVVMPFENNSKDQYAADRIRGMVITQILAQGLFDVVDKGLADSALREEAVDLSKSPVDVGVMKRLGQRLNAQALLLGSIDHAGSVQRGNTSYPELAMTLRLIDTNSGMIFWQASGSRTGDSMSKRLFGLGADDEYKIALRLLRHILSTISAEHKVKLPETVVPAPAISPSSGAAPAAPSEATSASEDQEAAAAGKGSTEGESDDQAQPMGEEEPLVQEVPPDTHDPEEEVKPPTEEAQTPDQELPNAEEQPPEQKEPKDEPPAQEPPPAEPVTPVAPAKPAAPATSADAPPPTEPSAKPATQEEEWPE